MTLHLPRLPFAIDPLIGEAKRRMRKRRLLVAVLAVALAGGAVGGTFAVRASNGHRVALGGRPTARFAVSGRAPRGVLVSYADSRSRSRVVESGSVPLHAWVSKKGVSFYQFRARLAKPGGGHITCTVRVGTVVKVSHASGPNSLCVVRARLPGGPSTGGAADRASFDLKAPPKPPQTAAMVAAAHRDEATLIRAFVLPPGAQRLAHAPALLSRLSKQIFGIGPTSQDRFARFGYWRVRSSVAAVTRFELAHQPLGADHQGCPHTQSTPLDRLCGVGLDTSKLVPANAALLFTFPRIHGLVGERELRVSILALPGGWTAVRAAATNHTWIPSRFRNRAGPLPQVLFVASPQRPVAGKPFTGVTVVDEDPALSPLVSVACGGVLGHRALPAQQHVSTTSPPPGRAGALARFEKVAKVREVTCTWRIPAGAAGQRLKVGNGSRFESRVDVSTGRSRQMSAYKIGSPEYSWIVRP